MKPPTADLGHPHTPNLTKATSCRVIRAPISFSWSNELRNRECGTTLLVAEDAESATCQCRRDAARPMSPCHSDGNDEVWFLGGRFENGVSHKLGQICREIRGAITL